MNKELSKEDILNVTGSVLDTMLDFTDNYHKEIESLEKENINLKQALIEIREYIKLNCIEVDGKYTELVCEGEELLQIIDKVGLEDE